MSERVRFVNSCGVTFRVYALNEKDLWEENFGKIERYRQAENIGNDALVETEKRYLHDCLNIGFVGYSSLSLDLYHPQSRSTFYLTSPSISEH